VSTDATLRPGVTAIQRLFHSYTKVQLHLP